MLVLIITFLLFVTYDVYLFTYESCDTLKSFALIITVKVIAKLNPEHSNKFEIKI